jgi:autotransporter passenger strand-loop-strand repeat protein
VVNSGGTLELVAGAKQNATTISSGGVLEIGLGETLSGYRASGGVTVEVLAGGTASNTTVLSKGIVTISSGGTAAGLLVASGGSSFVEIASGSIIRPSALQIGNGVVDVLSGGSANVRFLTGSGGLVIADTAGQATAFGGTVTGFGGANHGNHKQFIDLASVTSASGQIHLSYVSAPSHTSGTLLVSSGGAVVAQINMIGAYTSANFSAASDNNGKVKITDPVVPSGGSVEPTVARAFLQHDLLHVLFGTETTLAYSQNNDADAGGKPSVGPLKTPGVELALLGSYIAAFAADTGRGGSVLAEASPLSTQPMSLVSPHR